MHSHIVHRRPIAAARGGFTLVEMLVATTLVVLMMLMFAQIYLAAISSLGKQQASARNDSKARLTDLLLRGDLQRASFRSPPESNQGIVPLVDGDDVAKYQKGFFYLSENKQSNPMDDVLHFTTYVRESRNRDPSYYYGRCQPVPGVIEYSAAPSNAWDYANHPDLDDGDTGNEVGASKAAEVVYFVRGGNLYRRVLLIRDSDLGGQLGVHPSQPSRTLTTGQFNARIIPSNSPTTPSFYKAFDYAAFCKVNDAADESKDNVQFLGIDAMLDNSGDAPESFGRSFTRFGFAHNPADQLAPPVSSSPSRADSVRTEILRCRGMPVEYDNSGNFFGRPVHEETGSYRWRWPGERYNPLLAPLSYNVQTNQLSVSGTLISDTDTLRTRSIEDLLLSNVESFDVEVWDSGLYENNQYLNNDDPFVQLGHGKSTGYFRAACRLNPHYGPGGDRTDPLADAPNPERNWVFDTGHPDMWSDDPSLSDIHFKPPYRPLLYRKDAPVLPTKTATEWDKNATYQLGDVVFPVGNRTLSIAFRYVEAGTIGTDEPQWKRIPGLKTDDGTAKWEAFDNRVGLKKIRITVRVRDPIEGLARQFSIIHSFANP